MQSGRQKRILVLGAGPFQALGIRRAVKLGYYVISVDNLSNSIGHTLSHARLNCSTVDAPALLKAIGDSPIDGVVTFGSDRAVPSVAFLADKLRLFGPTPRSARMLCDKASFRTLQREHGRRHPGFLFAASWSELSPRLAELAFPVVFKPADNSGSRGVTFVNDWDVPACERAYEIARKHAAGGTVVVEELVPGPEVGGDAFLVDGHIAFVACTKKMKMGFVVTGHALPSALDDSTQDRIREELTATCAAAGYRDGPLNFDVILSDDGPVILEMSPRLGGNGIGDVMANALGIDLTELYLRTAAGDPWQSPEVTSTPSPTGSLVFGSKSAGVLERMTSADELKRRVPEVLSMTAGKSVGDAVEAFEHNGHALGYVVFDCQATSYEEVAERVSSALELVVRPRDAHG